MSEFKGTRGPWIVRDEDCQSVGTRDELTAICYGDENARLVAAAPELLEACLRIQAQFRQAGIESKAGSLNPVEDNAAQIDAAISKALGQ